jgi:hypothetical protein
MIEVDRFAHLQKPILKKMVWDEVPFGEPWLLHRDTTGQRLKIKEHLT